MSVRIKSLNGDTSFLIIFSPSCAGKNTSGTFPGSFTILTDPWIFGPSKVWNSKFALSHHTKQPCIESLVELPDPDLVLISQDKPDHCHQDTLTSLPADTNATILAAPAAARKIKSWKHFDSDQVHSLKRYDERKPDTVYRISIPPYSTRGTPGEVTIALIETRFDVAGIHNALGITYRPPGSVLSVRTASFINLPLTPPATPPPFEATTNPSPPTSTSSATAPRPKTSSSSSTITGPFDSLNPRNAEDPVHSPLHRERTLSLLYSPHGVSYSVIAPYATSHLLSCSALPLTALLYSFGRVNNNWYFGGNINAGGPIGAEIARRLFARAWIGAHDEIKRNSGISTRGLKVERLDDDELRRRISGVDESSTADGVSSDAKSPAECRTQLVELQPGEDFVLPAAFIGGDRSGSGSGSANSKSAAASPETSISAASTSVPAVAAVAPAPTPAVQVAVQ